MTEVQEEGVHPKTCTNLKRLMFHVDNILPWFVHYRFEKPAS